MKKNFLYTCKGIFFVLVFSGLCTGCATYNPWVTDINDAGYDFKRTTAVPKIENANAVLLSCNCQRNVKPNLLKELEAIDYFEKNNLLIVGSAIFLAKGSYAVRRAIPTAQKLGATHIIYRRLYHGTEEYDETRTGITSGLNTASATAVSGNVYASATSTSHYFVPYSYTVHVVENLFHHEVIFCREKDLD